MKKLAATIILIILVGAGFLFYRNKQNSRVQNTPPKNTAEIFPMTIQSPVFLDGQNIPLKYTCDGDGVNPPLTFSNIPKEAQSLALTISDPDAPNSTWYHWLVWNIGPSINSIAENSVPEKAVQGKASSGQQVYGGPCPPVSSDPSYAGLPSGHHYIFTLYALGSKLNIPSYSGGVELLSAIQNNIISQAQIVGLYNRNK